MSHAWSDLPAQLESAIKKVNNEGKDDAQLKYFDTTNAITQPSTFGIKAAGGENAVLATVTNGKVELSTGSSNDALFTLVAFPEQW